MPFASIVLDLVLTASGLIWLLIVGLVAGFLARVVMRGGGYGIVGDIIMGIIGAFIGGLLASVLGLGSTGLIGSGISGFIGSCIFIAGLRLLSTRVRRSVGR